MEASKIPQGSPRHRFLVGKHGTAAAPLQRGCGLILLGNKPAEKSLGMSCHLRPVFQSNKVGYQIS